MCCSSLTSARRPQKRKADADAGNAKRQKEDAGEGATTRLYCGGLPWSADGDSLKEFLTGLGHGEVTEANVVTDQSTGRSKGFGFATCSATTAAAIAALTDVELDGRTLRFDIDTGKGKTADKRQSFGERPKSAPGNSLIARNLSYNVDSESLQGHFEGATGARVITNPEDGSSKGFALDCTPMPDSIRRRFGFVDFATVEEAQAALDSFNGSEIDGRALALDFAAPRSNDGPRGGGRGGRGAWLACICDPLMPHAGGDRGGFRGGRGGFDRGGRGGFRGGRGVCRSSAPPSRSRARGRWRPWRAWRIPRRARRQ